MQHQHAYAGFLRQQSVHPLPEGEGRGERQWPRILGAGAFLVFALGALLAWNEISDFSDAGYQWLVVLSAINFFLAVVFWFFTRFRREIVAKMMARDFRSPRERARTHPRRGGSASGCRRGGQGARSRSAGAKVPCVFPILRFFNARFSKEAILTKWDAAIFSSGALYFTQYVFFIYLNFFVSFLVQVLLRPVTNVEHMHSISLDSKQDAENIAPCAVEELTDFFGKMPILRGQRTTRRKLCQGIDRLDHPRKPAGRDFGCPCIPVHIGGA